MVVWTVAKLLRLAQNWVDNMKSCNLTKTEVWVSLRSTIWRTLSYPLPTINLSKDQWERIMVIVLNYALPAMGICRNFLQSIVFAPDNFFGLGIQHLYTTQEITCLKDIPYQYCHIDRLIIPGNIGSFILRSRHHQIPTSYTLLHFRLFMHQYANKDNVELPGQPQFGITHVLPV